MKNKPHCVWIFGQAKSGKTTTAYNLMQKKLRNYILIDGDKFRRSRTPSLDYSREDIITNNRECLRMVKFLMGEGWNIIVSMITPFVIMQKEIKEQLGYSVLRVYLDCEYDASFSLNSGEEIILIISLVWVRVAFNSKTLFPNSIGTS